MATEITFDDGFGEVSLSNGLPDPGSHFKGWVPSTRPIGPIETGLGSGRPFRFKFRTDYGASFSLDEIPASSASIGDRLVQHLLNGGSVTITTGDLADREYDECVLAPDTVPSFTLYNPQEYLYRLEVSVINVGSQARMLCEYPI